jgi:IS30 family transposase
VVGIARGESIRAIARELGRAALTVSREVLANGGREEYHAFAAHRRARACVRRPKPAKLVVGPLCDQVTEWLCELWSPKEIAGRLRSEFKGDPMMQVSYETIYQSLYVQGRGELRRELARCLRRGHAVRKPQGFVQRRGKIPDMVMISERPAEVEDRAAPGHWEGDLIVGKNGHSQVGTLVERSTRFVLLHLPEDRTAATVEAAMRKAIRTLPAELMRSVTWDQGSELAGHKRFTLKTGIPIYFCDPHSPWQRGSNENTNGLLRQYMPKGTDLSKLSAKDLAVIQRSLNNRPRETLGFMKPSEKLAELVALTG